MTMLEEREAAGEVNPYEPQYTWTFDERALLIRTYLWVYQPSDPKNTTFCRLFWSTVCMPLMLPLRLLLIAFSGLVWTLRMAGAGIAWPVKQIPFAEYMDMIERRRERVQKARAIAAYEAGLERERLEEAQKKQRAKDIRLRMEQEDLGWWLWLNEYNGEMPPPKPRPKMPEVAMTPAPKTKFDKPKKVKEGPSIQEKFATSVADRADKISAFFQARPEIGKSIDRFFTKLGRIIVRFVFYPLMVIIPTIFVGFVGFELWEHRKGLGSGTESVAVPAGHGVAQAGAASWEAIVALCLCAVIGILFLIGFGWLMMKIDQWSNGALTDGSIPKPKEKVVLHEQSAIGRQVDRGIDVAWTGMKAAGRATAIIFEFFGRFLMEFFGTMGGPIGKVAGVIGKVCYAGAVGIVWVARSVFWVVVQIGRGIGYTALAVAAFVAAIFGLIGAAGKSIGGATSTTGKFFIMGHHTLKSRTCPKIVITSGEEE